MSKPREWWIDNIVLNEPPYDGWETDKDNDWKHVIEYSAYEQARYDRSRMEDRWREAYIAGEELKDKLAIAVEALEFYAGFSDEHRIFDNISLMARTALEKLK